MTEREPGYYWIKTFYKEPLIACFDGGDSWVYMTSGHVLDEEPTVLSVVPDHKETTRLQAENATLREILDGSLMAACPDRGGVIIATTDVRKWLLRRNKHGMSIMVRSWDKPLMATNW